VNDHALTSLLERAHTRFETIILEWTIDRDDALLDSAMRRRIRSQSGSAVALVDDDDGKLEAVGRHTSRARLWWRKPSFWRDEERNQDTGRLTRILKDSYYLGYSSRAGVLSTNAYASEAEPGPDMLVEKRSDISPYTLQILTREVFLVHPAFLLTACEITADGTTTHVGREAIKVTGVRRTPECRAFFRASETEYKLLVDAETGVLLRYASMVDEQEAWVLNVTSVQFNEPIADTVFAFQPPEGTRVLVTA
jgi:hypothetical protein